MVCSDATTVVLDCTCYLVDSASGHMLVSKTKPCKSKFISCKDETAKRSVNQLLSVRLYQPWITVVNLELIHCKSRTSCGSIC